MNLRFIPRLLALLFMAFAGLALFQVIQDYLAANTQNIPMDSTLTTSSLLLTVISAVWLLLIAFLLWTCQDSGRKQFNLFAALLFVASLALNVFGYFRQVETIEASHDAFLQASIEGLGFHLMVSMAILAGILLLFALILNLKPVRACLE